MYSRQSTGSSVVTFSALEWADSASGATSNLSGQMWHSTRFAKCPGRFWRAGPCRHGVGVEVEQTVSKSSRVFPPQGVTGPPSRVIKAAARGSAPRSSSAVVDGMDQEPALPRVTPRAARCASSIRAQFCPKASRLEGGFRLVTTCRATWTRCHPWFREVARRAGFANLRGALPMRKVAGKRKYAKAGARCCTSVPQTAGWPTQKRHEWAKPGAAEAF